MKFNVSNPVVFRYANLTEPDTAFNQEVWKVTAEMPRKRFDALVSVVSDNLAAWLASDACDLKGKDIGLVKNLDVATSLKDNRQDEDNPDIVLLTAKTKDPKYLTLQDDEGNAWDKTVRINHGSVGSFSFSVRPTVVNGRAYLSKYINSARIHENGDGNSDGMEI